MSVIEITRAHTMGATGAKTTADELAVGLSERFGVDYRWQDDILKFRRPGVKGQLEVDDEHIHIKLELGFMVRPFKDRIEREIHNHLDNMEGIG
jgi:putative polyhydroxyalkanoate system protein